MDALDVAESAGLLAEVEARAGTLRFVHVLVARAVYAGLPSGRRRRLHVRAAQALARQAGPPATHLAAQVARQYALGAMPAQARRWAITAGDYAAGQLSPAEAARWYLEALGHGPALDVPDAERADLLVRLGHAQQQADDPGALATLSEAAAVARGCGATAVLAGPPWPPTAGSCGPVRPPRRRPRSSSPPLRWPTPIRPHAPGSSRCGPRVSPPALGALELAREAIALADASRDPALLARICSSVLYALWGPDRAATRLRADVAWRAIAAAEAAGDPHLEFAVHAAAYTVAIQLADPARAASSLRRLKAIAGQIGAPAMLWTVGFYDTFVATMQARFADAGQLARASVEAGVAMGAADVMAVFAGQAAELAAIAGYRSELRPAIARRRGRPGRAHQPPGPGHSQRRGRPGKKVARELLDEAVSAGFRDVRPDLMWVTSMLGYATLAIELEDLGAAAELLAIIEPYATEIATNLGPVATYAGRLASLLDRHDAAEQHLTAAFRIADTFDWDYHRAAILIARAAARRRSTRKPGPSPASSTRRRRRGSPRPSASAPPADCLACSPPSRRSAGDAPVMRR